MKRIPWIVLVISLMLAACGGTTPQATAPTESPTVTAPLSQTTPQSCNPGTISIPDALYINKFLEASNWINWNDGKPVWIVVNSKLNFFYSWDEASDKVTLKLDETILQTEVIPQGSSASFALSATSPQGTTMLRSIAITHCGENSWAYSEDGKGEMKFIPNNSVQG